MRPKVSRRQAINAIKRERQQTIGLLAGLSDVDMGKPSLCDRWTVGQVAGHIVSGDDPPWSLIWSLATRHSIAEWMDQVIAKETARGRDHMITKLGRRDLPLFARFGGVGRNMVFGETLLHQEDIRRAVDKPRVSPPDPDVTWAYAWSQAGQLKKCKNAGRVKIESSDGRFGVWEVRPGARPKLTQDDASADVTVRGDPLELAMFLTGRLGAATVHIEGEGPLADELRSNPLKLGPSN